MSILRESIQYVKGIGPKKAYLLKRLGIETIEDMLWHFPRDYDNRANVKNIKQLKAGEKATIYGFVSGEARTSNPRKNLSIIKFTIKDHSGAIEAVFFNKLYLKKVLLHGQRVMINGEIKRGIAGLEITNPIVEKDVVDTEDDFQGIMPIYPSTEGLSQKEICTIQKKLFGILQNKIKEYLPESIRKKHRLCDIEFALRNIHLPNSVQELKIARYRLIFEELFILQLGLLKAKRGAIDDKRGIPLRQNKGLEEFVEKLPFKLTSAQEKVVSEILEDLDKDTPMNRLVQGDVGSGKTIVAIIALLKCVVNGYQGAFMAPTEILAGQHYSSMKELLEPLGVNIALLVGSLTSKQKNKVLKEIETGDVDIVIGTHALIQEGVNFANLSFVITDEQHRFGVRQRAILSSKGINPHVLVMTATPIPRTLALILYGDLDISIIDQLPPGRKTIKTFSRSSKDRQKIYDFVKKQLNDGRQAYVVCPLVEESEVIDAQSATQIAQELTEDLLRGYKIGLLHGKMLPKEKEQIMSSFKQGDIQVLVSTTVIEVGVDVPNSTVMVVENAERFGLAQLHQLRGRVGRGSFQSYCILVNNSKSEISIERMKIMEKSTDGFVISEKDLQLRGPGEFFGTRQHGLPELKIANLFRHMSILKIVQGEIEELIKSDNDLSLKEYPMLEKKLDEKFFSTDEDIAFS